MSNQKSIYSNNKALACGNLCSCNDYTYPSALALFYFYIVMATLTCLNCKKVITIPSHQAKKRKFCSRSCSVSYRNRNRVWKQSSKNKISKANTGRLSGDKNPNYQGGGKLLICEYCGKEFSVAVGQLTANKYSGRFCSLGCYHNRRFTSKLPKEMKRINKAIIGTVMYLIRKNKNSSSSKWFDILGWNISDFRSHIESQFDDKMSWGNYGCYWHIDHVKPISYFNYTSEQDKNLRECWKLSNLQPLLKEENFKKGGRNTLVNQLKYGK